MINRRSFLAGSSAIGVGAAAPAGGVQPVEAPAGPALIEAGRSAAPDPAGDASPYEQFPNAPSTIDEDGNIRLGSGELLPRTLKEAAPWAVCAFCLPTGWRADGGVGPAADLMARHCSGYIVENGHKWIYQERKGRNPDYSTWDWSAADAIDAAMVPVLQPNPKRVFHLGIGPDLYNPEYVAATLAANPAQVRTLARHRMAGIKAKYPGMGSGASSDPFYRIDVVNEVTNQGGEGWRTSRVAFYTASHDAAVRANAGNAEQWIWDCFLQLRDEYPTTKLAWVDFLQEVASVPDPGTYIYWNDQPVFASNNEFLANKVRSERLRFEIWRARSAGVPIDSVGFQFHLWPANPPEFQGFSYMLQDYNAMGVLPHVTELTVDLANRGRTPPHCPPNSYRMAQYGAWYSKHYLDVMLRDSPCEEVSGWSPAGGAQSWWVGSRTYPLLRETIRALRDAQSPRHRRIRRSRRTDFRHKLPPWVNSTASVSHARNRLHLTSPGSLTIPWVWYSQRWMARPISETSMTLVLSWYHPEAGVPDGSVLFGYGAAARGSWLVVHGTRSHSAEVTLQIDGATTLRGASVGTVMPGTINTLALRVEGSNPGLLAGCMNGGDIVVFKRSIPRSLVNVESIYLGSLPDGSGISAIELITFDVHHNGDYPGIQDFRDLASPMPRRLGLPFFAG